jgi:hypothetical protein
LAEIEPEAWANVIAEQRMNKKKSVVFIAFVPLDS